MQTHASYHSIFTLPQGRHPKYPSPYCSELKAQDIWVYSSPSQEQMLFFHCPANKRCYLLQYTHCKMEVQEQNHNSKMEQNGNYILSLSIKYHSVGISRSPYAGRRICSLVSPWGSPWFCSLGRTPCPFFPGKFFIFHHPSGLQLELHSIASKAHTQQLA